jgi:hypothetical protein
MISDINLTSISPPEREIVDPEGVEIESMQPKKQYSSIAPSSQTPRNNSQQDQREHAKTRYLRKRDQQLTLERQFRQCPAPSDTRMEELSKELEAPLDRVIVRFSNK